jgi:myb proto-oncogene protein
MDQPKIDNPLHLNPKSTWTKEEDVLLSEIVRAHGARNWPQVSTFLPGRSGKQCRERYKNHLDPGVKKSPFAFEEDMLIVRLVEEHGQKWAFLATLIPGRTDNAIKNRYNSSLRRAHEEGRFNSEMIRGIVPSTPPDSPNTETLPPTIKTPMTSATNTPQHSPTSHRRVYNKRKPSRPLLELPEDEIDIISIAKAMSSLTSKTPSTSPRVARRVDKRVKSAPSSPRGKLFDATDDLAAAVALCELKCLVQHEGTRGN